MSNTLIAYSTDKGQTLKICNKIKTQLEGCGEVVSLHNLAEGDVDLARFDKILIGASIKHGKHAHRVFKFIKEKQPQLEQKPSGFFSVSLVARKPGKDSAETNPYMQAFLKRISWTPDFMEVFGGMVDYQRYNFFDRHIIRFIMRITKGPTNLDACIEYTDWDKVDRFSQRVANY
ncbi:menaquinone-dependent protoporphyrinogen IX dehydrogenase [Ferrimonas sp. YFM]|uniref:menaquinone-dependent protoporphyrinogen IX dehydrogenase n=1 Tax=Ferrimonas sp. YFM TaxID=3028878 RepID=UPI0025725FC4|nr:menaquinone-dependent protoporphyrinogen IX dehydrogenase [Ferrimonas sp. YFM]BDY05150.1 oxygen-independent protoporphyrinogen oxidase HemG [Ferrimonas sp. YFM]